MPKAEARESEITQLIADLRRWMNDRHQNRKGLI